MAPSGTATDQVKNTGIGLEVFKYPPKVKSFCKSIFFFFTMEFHPQPPNHINLFIDPAARHNPLQVYTCGSQSFTQLVDNKFSEWSFFLKKTQFVTRPDHKRYNNFLN